MSVTRPISSEQKPEGSDTWQVDTGGSIELLESLRRENDQLRTALVTRIVIEQAKGVLAERFNVGVDEAFERLRREARNRRMRLHALAAAVVAREAWTEPIFRRSNRVRQPPAAAAGGGLSLPAATAKPEQT
jgi:hypothetical protein